MTPEERVNQETWWLLQEIKKEYLSTPSTEKVSFDIRLQSKKSKKGEDEIPSPDTQRKLLKVLREWRAIDCERRLDGFQIDLEGTPAMQFLLKIHKDKFDAIYGTYEGKNEPPDEEVAKALKNSPPLLDFEEAVLSRICKEVKKLPRNDLIQTCTFFASQTDDDEEQNIINRILDTLKKEGIITSYEYKVTDEVGYTMDGSPFEFDVVWAVCELSTKKFSDHILKLWQPKKAIVDTLGKNCLNLIRIIELYFENPQNRDSQLNKFYLQTCDKIWELIFHKDLSPRLRFLYKKPFDSLFSAEKELEESGGKLKDIINSLNAFNGEVHKLLAVYDTNFEAEDETEKIEGYISSLEAQQKSKTKKDKTPIQRIEGKIEVDGLTEGLERIAMKDEEETVVKGKKKIRLPHFSPTPWSDITVRFLDERNVLLKSSSKNVTTNYEALGFSNDKSSKPNLAWIFWLEMARNNGETKPIPSPIPDNIKQLKLQISDFLKKIFKNDTDPFYDFSETNTYKIKMRLVPPQSDNEVGTQQKDHLGVKEFLQENMPSKYESPKREDDSW